MVDLILGARCAPGNAARLECLRNPNLKLVVTLGDTPIALRKVHRGRQTQIRPILFRIDIKTLKCPTPISKASW